MKIEVLTFPTNLYFSQLADDIILNLADQVWKLWVELVFSSPWFLLLIHKTRSGQVYRIWNHNQDPCDNWDLMSSHDHDFLAGVTQGHPHFTVLGQLYTSLSEQAK